MCCTVQACAGSSARRTVVVEGSSTRAPRLCTLHRATRWRRQVKQQAGSRRENIAGETAVEKYWARRPAVCTRVRVVCILGRVVCKRSSQSVTAAQVLLQLCWRSLARVAKQLRCVEGRAVAPSGSCAVSTGAGVCCSWSLGILANAPPGAADSGLYSRAAGVQLTTAAHAIAPCCHGEA